MWRQDQRTSKQYKEFQDELRGKDVRKTDTGKRCPQNGHREEMIATRTLSNEVARLNIRLARVEKVLHTIMAAEQLSRAGQEQPQWGKRGEPDVIYTPSVNAFREGAGIVEEVS